MNNIYKETYAYYRRTLCEKKTDIIFTWILDHNKAEQPNLNAKIDLRMCTSSKCHMHGHTNTRFHHCAPGQHQIDHHLSTRFVLDHTYVTSP
jgi:hypothetical protein